MSLEYEPSSDPLFISFKPEPLILMVTNALNSTSWTMTTEVRPYTINPEF